VNGAELHYEIAGSGGPALVLVHGGCCAASDWKHQIPALSADFRVLAMDLRGHGASTGAADELSVPQWAADVNALLEALGLGPAALVGHSLGSRIVAEAAWMRRDNVSALVLLDGSRTTGGFAATAPQPDVLQDKAQATDLVAILDRTISPHAPPPVREQIIRTMSAPAPAIMQAAVGALAQWDRERADIVFPGLAGTLPILAIQSTYHDHFTPRRSFDDPHESSPYLDYLRSVLPQVEVEVLTATGHFSMMERPDRVTALIGSFARLADDKRKENPA
jgi:pimeloyl-ACP methyl ester carboxylesterase